MLAMFGLFPYRSSIRSLPLASVHGMLSERCITCMALVTISSSVQAKTINQISVLDNAELGESIEGLIRIASRCSPELGCTQASMLHFSDFVDFLDSVEHTNADDWKQNLVELSSEWYRPQQVYMLEETFLLAGKVTITVNFYVCEISICIEW